MGKSTETGVGDVFLQTTALPGGGADQYLIPFGAFNVTEAVESEETIAEFQVAGVLQTAEAGRSRETTTISLTTQIVNSVSKPLITGHFAKTFENISIEMIKSEPVPADLSITDVAITVANLPFIKVSKSGVGRLTPTAAAATAPASASEVQIDTTANALVFFAGEAGVDVAYTVPTLIASAKGYGGPGGVVPIGRLSLNFGVFGLDGNISAYRWYPAIDIIGKPERQFSGSVPEVTIEARAITLPGWSAPYREIDAASIVLAA